MAPLKKAWMRPLRDPRGQIRNWVVSTSDNPAGYAFEARGHFTDTGFPVDPETSCIGYLRSLEMHGYETVASAVAA